MIDRSAPRIEYRAGGAYTRDDIRHIASARRFHAALAPSEDVVVLSLCIRREGSLFQIYFGPLRGTAIRRAGIRGLAGR
jgi:hypothetical protein